MKAYGITAALSVNVYDEILFKSIFDGYPPMFLCFRNVNQKINELLRYEYHKKNNLPEHHALNDALRVSGAARTRPGVMILRYSVSW